jgi:hypothetical protein
MHHVTELTVGGRTSLRATQQIEKPPDSQQRSVLYGLKCFIRDNEVHATFSYRACLILADHLP